jgi:hypothetical protein
MALPAPRLRHIGCCILVVVAFWCICIWRSVISDKTFDCFDFMVTSAQDKDRPAMIARYVKGVQESLTLVVPPTLGHLSSCSCGASPVGVVSNVGLSYRSRTATLLH